MPYLTTMDNSPRYSRRFAPRKTGDASPLGELENAIMHLVWSHKNEVSVSDISAAMPSHQTAYTTLKTTMERLADKGILKRTRQGKAYFYRAAISQDELERRIVSETLDHLMEHFPAAVASFFVRPDVHVSEDRLDLLREAIQRQQENRDA
jgi:predicted transcriptional regulator